MSRLLQLVEAGFEMLGRLRRFSGLPVFFPERIGIPPRITSLERALEFGEENFLQVMDPLSSQIQI